MEEKLHSLDDMAKEIEASGIKLLDKIDIVGEYDEDGGTYYVWRHNAESQTLQYEVLRKYQLWYSTGCMLIKEYLPEREDEFNGHYKNNGKDYHYGVLDHILLKCPPYSTDDMMENIKLFLDEFEMQRGILLSISSALDIKRFSLKKSIAVDFIESEIDKADYLLRNGFERCAGVIAGVALERHLRVLCDINKVEYKHNDTIEPLINVLYKAGKIDVTESKKFNHLGSIRNDCAHPKDITEDVLKGRAKELVEKVKKLTL